MARGWGSKAVEDQLEENLRTRQEAATASHSAEAMELKRKRETMLLQRSHLLEQQQSARSDAHRRMLESSLLAIDAELAAM